MKKLLKVFIVDKDETSSALISSYLYDSGCKLTVERFENLSSAKKLIDINAINLFIVDTYGKEDDCLAEIDDIENTFKNCKFIITSYNLKTDFIIKCLRNSKKDFIEKPIIKKNFIEIVKEIYEKMTSDQDFSGHGKVVSVFSNKGGLGKTTISVNLAWQLSCDNPSNKVIVLDMNTFLGDITTFLDISIPYDINFIIEKIQSGVPIFDIINTYDNSNLYIAANSPYCENDNNILSSNMLKFFNVRKFFKYIIVDTSSAVTEQTKQIFDISDMILLVTEANLPVLNNCKRCLDYFEKLDLIKKTELILNRYSYDDDCSLQDVESVLKKEVFTGLPNDWKTTLDSINKGLTISENSPNTDINDAYIELAQLVMKKLCH